MRAQLPQLPDRAPSAALVGLLCLVIGWLSQSWVITGIALLLFAPMVLFVFRLVIAYLCGLKNRMP